jgi:hypothetical protein
MEQKSTPEISSNTALINTIRTLADHDMEFCIFHKFVYEEITNWMNSNGPNRMTVAEDPKGDKYGYNGKNGFLGDSSLFNLHKI